MVLIQPNTCLDEVCRAVAARKLCQHAELIVMRQGDLVGLQNALPDHLTKETHSRSTAEAANQELTMQAWRRMMWVHFTLQEA